jgi:hypothetical protein
MTPAFFVVLQSIYGDESIRFWRPDSPKSSAFAEAKNVLRYTVTLNLPDPHEDVSVKILVSLPPTYPASSSPQLQLLSRYIGPFGVDTELFSSVLRTFISHSGIEWTPDSVCVFDGLQNVLERCTSWYEIHLSADLAGELAREDEKDVTSSSSASHPPAQENGSQHAQPAVNASLPEGIQIFEAEPITDRKSAFIGRACAITDPSQVCHILYLENIMHQYFPPKIPIILSHLMSDRRIARAAHPIINAWRCQAGNILHQGNKEVNCNSIESLYSAYHR